jgi:prepilin signal peptidase PulO-like enzyme (type II secretory pathway)
MKALKLFKNYCKRILLKVLLVYIKNCIPAQHIISLIAFIVIFYIGNINLITLDIKFLPLQLLILLLNYLMNHFILLTKSVRADIEKSIPGAIEEILEKIEKTKTKKEL